MRTVVTICMVFLSLTLKAQTNIDLYPSPKEVTENAKRSTKYEIRKLQQSFFLSRREIRLRKFELCACSDTPEAMDNRGGKSLTPIGELDQVEGCPGEYYFQHKTNRNGSHYTLTFFYDTDGDLIDTNIAWTMVVH